MKTLSIGFNNYIILSHLHCIVSPESAGSKRLRDNAKEQGLLIDATVGKRTKAILVMDNNSVVLSAITVETLIQRINNQEEN